MILKGTVQRYFQPLFFHRSNQPGSLTDGLKYLRIWFSDYLSMILRAGDYLSMILRGLKVLFILELFSKNEKYYPLLVE